MTVFVDTSAILAIFDVDDPRHRAAAEAWTSILESDEEILTSNYVILETFALLHSRFGASMAREFVENMVPAMAVFWVDQSVHNAATSATLAVPGKSGPSLVDCASFEVMRRRATDRVLAYDRHFRSRGYNLVAK